MARVRADNGRGTGRQADLRINHVQISPNRTRLTARLDGDLVHQDVINVGSAAARQRFAEAVSDRPMVDRVRPRNNVPIERLPW